MAISGHTQPAQWESIQLEVHTMHQGLHQLEQAQELEDIDHDSTIGFYLNYQLYCHSHPDIIYCTVLPLITSFSGLFADFSRTSHSNTTFLSIVVNTTFTPLLLLTLPLTISHALLPFFIRVSFLFVQEMLEVHFFLFLLSFYLIYKFSIHSKNSIKQTLKNILIEIEIN